MVPARKLFAVAQDEAPRGLTRDAWSVAGASPSDEEEQTTMRRGARVLVSATVLSLAVSDARAEILPYDNDTQRFGAALVVPIGRRELVRRTMEFCGTAYPAMKADTQIAYAGWIRRHSGYLRLNTTMRNGFVAALAKDQTEKAAEARKLLEYGSDQIEKISTLLVQKVVSRMADGVISEGVGGCVVEFSDKRLVSECRRNDRAFRVVYSYRVTDAGRYEAEIVENQMFPTLVGTRAIVSFRVEGGELFTSTFPSTTNGGPTRPVEIEAVLVPDTPSGGIRE